MRKIIIAENNTCTKYSYLVTTLDSASIKDTSNVWLKNQNTYYIYIFLIVFLNLKIHFFVFK